MNPDDLTVRHDEEAGRFETDLECGTAYVAYRLGDGALDLVSTWVPTQHRELGIGARVVTAALEYAREHGLEVIPTCPFVPRVLADHPEYEGLVRDA
jgi:hypothetical protein